MSPSITSQQTCRSVKVSITFGLALMALLLVTASQAGALAPTAKSDLTPPALITQTYVIFASGPSGNNMSAHLSDPGGGGDTFQILGGGIYGGDGGHIQNIYVNGNPPRPIDIVSGCSGTCNVGGNAVVNYNAEPLPTPTLYNIADFQPGGVYAVAAGSAYHSFASDQSFSGNLSAGLYYIDGDVDLHDVMGTASIIATGDIQFLGGLRVTTYDARFPLLFSTSSDVSIGTISAHNPTLDLTGDLYAPNGLINISGAIGPLHGRVYGKSVALDASRMTITCPACDLSWLAYSLQKTVTPQ